MTRLGAALPLTLLLMSCGGGAAAPSASRTPAPIVVSATNTPAASGSASAKPAATAATATPASGNQVRIQDFSFGPAALTAPVGTRVAWTNAGPSTHTVTANDGSFDSGQVLANAKFEFTFTKAGSFTYHCTFHPTMTATIVVS